MPSVIDAFRDPVCIHLGDLWDQVEARAREMNDSHRVDHDYRIGPDTDIHLRGAAGEFAFHVWSGLPLTRVKPRGGIRGPDFMLGSHRGVDVKCTMPSQHLLPSPRRTFASEIFCLAWWDGVERDVWLVGWVDRGTFLAENHRRVFCQEIGEQRFYPWYELEKMADLDVGRNGP